MKPVPWNKRDVPRFPFILRTKNYTNGLYICDGANDTELTFQQSTDTMSYKYIAENMEWLDQTTNTWRPCHDE